MQMRGAGERGHEAGHRAGAASTLPAMLPSLWPVLSPWPALLRAGAFGALHGGHPGRPALGLTVEVGTPAEVRAALRALEEGGGRATLLVPPALARLAPQELWQAQRAGHELAGRGAVGGLSLLEAVGAQPLTLWERPARPGGAELRRLARLGLRPLPAPGSRPEPGGTLRLRPEELRAALPRLRRLGYAPGPVGELPELRPARGRDLFGHLYTRLVEDRFTREHGVIDLTERADALLRVAALDHAPPPLPLPPGTPTAELHAHSARLVGLAGRGALTAYRAYLRSLRDVGAALRERPELAQAEAVFAVTLFHGPLEQAGFHMVALPPLRARWYGLGFRLLRAAYGTTRTPSEGTPRLAWLSREEYLAKFG